MAMARVLYTAEGHVTGDRGHGTARTSDGAVDVQIRAPKELGGEGGGTNPEQLFALGFGSCFANAVATVARRQKLDPGQAIVESRVMLGPGEDRGFVLGVELDVTLPSIDDPEQAAALVRTAHKVCPYSNATRGNIHVTLTANGQEL